MKNRSQEKDWYWEAVIECLKGHYELLSFYLFEAGATGIQETFDAERTIRIKTFFPSDFSKSEKIENSLNEIVKVRKISANIKSVTRKPYLDWTSGWKTHFKPLKIGNNFLVRPPWEKSVLEKLEIVIDPGQGFGTGYHPSTVIALMLLEWLSNQRNLGQVIDVGAGSGILTIGALLKGASAVTAIDIDENVIDEIRKNLRLSGLEVERCEILSLDPQQLSATFDVVMANIETEILSKLMTDLHRLTRPSKFLILSGILFELRSEFRSGIHSGMQVIKELQIEDWWGIILRKERSTSE